MATPTKPQITRRTLLATSAAVPLCGILTRPASAAEFNYKLGTQLPYLMIINRLAHYLKVLQREQLGSWKERTDLEEEQRPIDPRGYDRPRRGH